MLVLKTNLGDITIELFEKDAPISSENFLSYAKAGFYDGTIFHRVISGFMIQGGGFTADLERKATKSAIKNESKNGCENKKYTLAMARTNVPDSATSQFFINVVDNDFLNQKKSQDGVGYAVFGQVVEGHDIVDKIGASRTGTRGGMSDVPIDAIVIETVEIT